jgi:hypothetical protein
MSLSWATDACEASSRHRLHGPTSASRIKPDLVSLVSIADERARVRLANSSSTIELHGCIHLWAGSGPFTPLVDALRGTVVTELGFQTSSAYGEPH